MALPCLGITDKAAGSMRGHLNNINVGFVQAVMEEMDVAEVYSPPRIADMAKKMGLRAGWSLDLTTCDESGKPWDFRDEAMRNQAARKVIRDQPLLLIGSPPCTDWCQLMNLNWASMSEEETARRRT